MEKMLAGKSINPDDYKPNCLTIYPSHQCNLNCTYCYIPQKEIYPDEYIRPEIVESGARIVADNCMKRKLSFVVGFHGGNEPLLHQEKIEEYLTICRKVAVEHNLKFIPHCTTNGVIPEETAKWASKSFSRMTLSCDGPPDLNDAYRKDRNNNPTSHLVEGNARIFSQSLNGKDRFLIRCTISSLSVERMVEIVRYFQTWGVKVIEFYPVFRSKTPTFPDDLIPDSRLFVYHFMKAKHYGMQNGMKILFPGTRVYDFHSRFCMLLQDNLTLTPDGYITNCYHCTQNYSGEENALLYGKYCNSDHVLELDKEKINGLYKIYINELLECKTCFNQFHCSHGCPEICPFEERYTNTINPDCDMEKWISLAFIINQAGYIKEFEGTTECSDFFENVKYWKIN